MNPRQNLLIQTTRREFLRTSTVGVAATATLGALEISRTAHAAGSDTLRVGMIGCGGRNTGAGLQALAVPIPAPAWWRCATFSSIA